jgi:hypothetical protein
MKVVSITITLIAILFFGINTTNAQNGYSVANAITVDLGASNTITLNNVSSQNSTGSASGMTGVCSSITCCSMLVYKVIIPQEGALYASSNNFVTQSMSMILYTASANPTDWTDLTYYAGEAGNFCDYRDTLFVGRKYRKWAMTPYWSATGSTIAAGTYYLLFWNYSQQRSTGGASNLTFEFTPYCVGDQPEIEVEGNSTGIADGDDTPSTSDDTDFGTMVTGAAAVSKTFTVKNVSIHDLDISNTTITGDQAANFSVTASPAATVSGNSSTTFTVEFTPNTTGVNNATIEITNTDCDRALFNFDLKAFVLGVAPSDKRGNMITLDGSDDYVDFDNIASKMVGEDDFTFEAWINADGGQVGNDRIFAVNTSSGGNRILFFLDDGVIESYESSGDTYSNASLYTDLRDDKWHHIALTHDGSTNTHSVYLDGQLVASKSGTVSSFAADNRWSLGQEYDGGTPGDFFQGKMDEVRIWKDVRTQDEIQTNMNISFTQAQLAGLENLVAYYQFDNDDATGTTDGVKDLLGNHGTLKNGGTYSASEVAVGNGSSEKQTINATGTYDFSTVGVELTFSGGTVPNGDIVISKITTENPKNVSAGELANNPTSYWVIRNLGTNSGLNVDIKFKFDDGQIDDNMVANHKIHKRGSNEFDAGDWTDLAPSNVNSASGDNHITVNVTSFSQFAATSSTSDFQAVLPVELVYFAGRATDYGTLLTWQTAIEENNEGFEIQRSTNGKDWENIGFISGQGTTHQSHTYDFKDLQPNEGTNYYRLKQVDFNGQFEYSNMVTVNYELGMTNNELKIFPNPVQNELTITNGKGQAVIYNMLGQPVRELIINNEQLIINTSDLAKGQYILHIQKQNGTMITKRFTKQH